MKYYETNFVDYVKRVEQVNLHKNYENLNKDIPFSELKHYIFHGPPGIGKYTQSMRFIKKYSDTQLNYVKKVPISVQNKADFIIKISDIHYEIDMNLLGCNARTLWHDIHNQILDIVMASYKKKGIILCKNFEHIHPELLDIFYCYMNNTYKNISIKYIILTTNISSIPRNLLNCTSYVSFSRPNIKLYNKVISNLLMRKLNKNEKQILNESNISAISNIKDIFRLKPPDILYKNICNKIYEIIIKKPDKVNYFELREGLYNILLYHHDVYECFYYILNKLYNNNYIVLSDLLSINIKVIELAKLYNNNYRPIFHLEKFTLYLNSKIKHDEL